MCKQQTVRNMSILLEGQGNGGRALEKKLESVKVDSPRDSIGVFCYRVDNRIKCAVYEGCSERVRVILAVNEIGWRFWCGYCRRVAEILFEGSIDIKLYALVHGDKMAAEEMFGRRFQWKRSWR